MTDHYSHIIHTIFAIAAILFGTALSAQEVNCTDGIDNDMDMLIDCLDPDCSCSPGPPFALDTLGDGGFENGATLAANNWMEDGNSGTNQWEVGTAPTNIPLGNCGFISDDAGVTHNYSLFSSTDTRIYHEVDLSVFAATDVIELSFDYKAWMDDGTWDALHVRVGTGCPQTPCDYMIQNLHNQDDWVRESVDISSYYPDIVQIEFYFESGTCCGTNPPAAIDNVMVYKLTADELLSEKNVDFLGYGLGSENVLEWSIDASYEIEEVILERALAEGVFQEYSKFTNITSQRYSSAVVNPQILEIYRLKITEAGGNTWYSRTIRVENSQSEVLIIYPNPARTEVNYHLKNFQLEEILMFDGKGDLVHSELNPDLRSGRMKLSDVAPGIYTVIFKSDSKQIAHKIVIVD